MSGSSLTSAGELARNRKKNETGSVKSNQIPKIGCTGDETGKCRDARTEAKETYKVMWVRYCRSNGGR